MITTSGSLRSPLESGDPNSLAQHMTAVLQSRITAVIRRRLVQAVPLLFVVSALSFVLVSLIPGDPATVILGTNASPEAVAVLRDKLGLGQPLHQQYWLWVRHAVSGNLGKSLFTGEDVVSEIATRLPITMSLMLGALLVSVVVGLALGVFSAARGGLAGRIVDGFALIGFALPPFWLGAGLIVIFAVQLRWLPATGYVPLDQSPGLWLQSLVLPVVALALHGIAGIAKHTREAMLDALASESVRIARSNGIAARLLIFQDALKFAGIRVVTILGLQVIGLLGGTVVIENVFALPGLGSLAVQGTTQHDIPVIQGIVVYFTVVVVLVNLLIDIAYTWLDPRVRTS